MMEGGNIFCCCFLPGRRNQIFFFSSSLFPFFPTLKKRERRRREKKKKIQRTITTIPPHFFLPCIAEEGREEVSSIYIFYTRSQFPKKKSFWLQKLDFSSKVFQLPSAFFFWPGDLVTFLRRRLQQGKLTQFKYFLVVGARERERKRREREREREGGGERGHKKKFQQRAAQYRFDPDQPTAHTSFDVPHRPNKVGHVAQGIGRITCGPAVQRIARTAIGT